mmetsp:Transcript_34737/g.90964  ORF Transcript_34737/g.90964 Transcript_34737/m.90964 type:complete len:247 (-) Transcript_34737:570-1310(-)
MVLRHSANVEFCQLCKLVQVILELLRFGLLFLNPGLEHLWIVASARLGLLGQLALDGVDVCIGAPSHRSHPAPHLRGRLLQSHSAVFGRQAFVIQLRNHLFELGLRGGQPLLVRHALLAKKRLRLCQLGGRLCGRVCFRFRVFALTKFGVCLRGLESLNLLLEFADDFGRSTFVDYCLVYDTLGVVGVPQCGERLVVIVEGGGYRCHHHRLGVAAKGLAQDPRQYRVAIRNVQRLLALDAAVLDKR